MALSSLFIILLAGLGIYSIAMSRTAAELAPPQQLWHLASFTLGLLAALAVFIPSPDILGPDHRFTVSMGQMLFAVDLGPLLLFLGIPTVMLQPLLRWDTLGRRLTRTLLVGLVSTTVLFGWFVPVFFEAASGDLTIWILKQMMFLVSGLLFWWPVAGPLLVWRPAYPVQILYLFIMRIPMTILGIFITFANQLIYTSRSFALEICAPSSLSDQLAGGLVMWSGGGLIVIAAFVAVFFRWFGAQNTVESKEF